MSAVKVIGVAALVWLLRTQYAVASRRMTAGQVKAIIDRINAAEFGNWFDPLDVLAVAQIESGFDPDAERHEARLDDSSLGLMQVLFSTAKDRGYAGGPMGLFDPEANVRVGMRQLKWSHEYLSDRLGYPPERARWIGSYNAGVGNALRNNWSSEYVNRWHKAREAF